MAPSNITLTWTTLGQRNVAILADTVLLRKQQETNSNSKRLTTLSTQYYYDPSFDKVPYRSLPCLSLTQVWHLVSHAAVIWSSRNAQITIAWEIAWHEVLAKQSCTSFHLGVTCDSVWLVFACACDNLRSFWSNSRRSCRLFLFSLVWLHGMHCNGHFQIACAWLASTFECVLPPIESLCTEAGIPNLWWFSTSFGLKNSYGNSN